MATLGFSTQWPKNMGGKYTNFIPKIYRGLHEHNLATYQTFLEVWRESHCYGTSVVNILPTEKDIINAVPKLHTIRKDSKNLWVPGRKIHMVVFNRTQNRFQFAPVLEVKSVQKIEINHHGFENSVQIDNGWFDMFNEKDGCLHNLLSTLAVNDGFESEEQFFQWFNTDFTGKIIHWTDLKY